MTLFGFMALVPEAGRKPRVRELGDAVRHALLQVQMQGKVLADAMGLRESHLSRQLNEQGVNIARLMNADTEFWSHFLKPFTELIGLSREQVLTIFGAADDKREAEDAARDKRIAELERQLADVIRRLPLKKEDETETRVA